MSKDSSLGKSLYVINDEEMWNDAMTQSESKLVVIDMHQEWCGCCESVHPSIARIFNDYEDCEKRFVYGTASFGKVGDKIREALPSDTKIDNSCLPLFGIFRVRKSCYSPASHANLS
jgi:hypothetical protein